MKSDQWTTRAEIGTDIPAIRRINLGAFETSSEADLVDSLRTDSSWIDGLSVVATDAQDRPIAHALLTRCRIDNTPALCLAPCAVLPEHQGSGAGSAAIRAALSAARELGESFVVVLGHPTYYPKFGCSRASLAGISVTFDVSDDA